MGDEGRLDYVVPGDKKVNLALFWATNFFGDKDKVVIDKAESMLKEHGVSLICWPSSKLKTADNTFDFGSEQIRREQYTDIYRKLADAAGKASKRQSLYVLFCQYMGLSNGTTVFEGPMTCFRTPMVLISPTPGNDGATLLHETGHAALIAHDNTSTGTTGRNFMNETESRSTMMKWQLEKLAKAFFIS